MSLRIRRGGQGVVPPVPPVSPPYGPTQGDDYVRNHAGTVANPATPSGSYVTVGAGGLTQAAINAAGTGRTIYMTGKTTLTSGSLTLMSGQTLMGPADHTAILSGATAVTAAAEGGYWTVTGQGIGTLGDDSWTNGQREIDGIVSASYLKKDMVFLDDFPLWQVPTSALLDQPTPYGWPAFYWDYAANKIWMRENPTGRTLEVCRNGGSALTANNASLKNIVVEKFGPRAQTGMVQIGQNGYAENCWFRGAHGVGCLQSTGIVSPSSLVGCRIYYNGQAGVGGGHFPAYGAGPITLTDTEWFQNNMAGYGWTHEGGATKWNRVADMTMAGCWIHDNYGMGGWTDGSNYDVIVQDSVFEDNYGSGFEAELGYNHIIRRNSFYRNGFHHPFPDAWAGGPHAADVMGVEIYQNNVIDNASGICAVETDRDSTGGAPSAGYITEIKNLDVHDNYIRHPSSHPSDTEGFGMGIAAGLMISSTTVSPSSLFYTSFNNRWYNNTYLLGNLSSGTHFRWQTGRMTWAQWRAAGQDGGSTAEQI